MDIKELYKHYGELGYDVYLYSGDINAQVDSLRCKIIAKENKKENVILFLTTPGGDADWAYRLVSVLKSHYKYFVLAIPSYCKSAGTLIALGADELRFHKQGELGPLDIQIRRKDSLVGQNSSGLDIFNALSATNQAAFECFQNIFINLIASSNGGITTETAAHIATDLSSKIYSAIASKIDPLDLGERNRIMNIASKYANIFRVSFNCNNVKPLTVEELVSNYPSHGFVIDFQQAQDLFNTVKPMDKCDIMVCNNFSFLSSPQREAVICDIEEYIPSIDKKIDGDEKVNSNNCEGQNNE